MTRRPKKLDWLGLAAELVSGAVRTLPAVDRWKKDKLLLRDALVNVAVATDFPMAEAFALWRSHKGRSVTERAIDAFPDLLENEKIRAWLLLWAKGPRVLQ